MTFLNAHRISLVVLTLLFAPQSANAELVTLYDGTGLPANQPWLAYAALGGTVTQTVVSGGVALVTDNPVSAGYSNYSLLGQKNVLFPSLDRAQGFELSFSAQINNESHASNNRAGFSVILLDRDRQGIEIGFWENEIWAQTSSPLFTHGAGAIIDTTIRRDYRLRVLGNSFTVAEGANTLLTGTVQDYTAFGGPPYTLPNYVFFGDDTSSASANLFLGPITLNSDLSSVPEPGSLAVTGMLLSALTVRRRKNRRPAIGR